MNIQPKQSFKQLKISHLDYALCQSRKLFKRFWFVSGKLESWALRKKIKNLALNNPIYVLGLPRSGTTITLECLSHHPDVATHCYRDMAQPYLPFVWNRLLKIIPLPKEAQKDRVHQDRIKVTRDSPEAVEEMIWHDFFPGLFDESRSMIMDASDSHPKFERYYKATLSKLVLTHQRTRYLSKGNYHVARVPYLQKIFSDAKFVVMVRNPLRHYVSWMKQHRLFLKTQAFDARWVSMIRGVGHSEFGVDQAFMNMGDLALTQKMRTYWDEGNTAAAFGLYWHQVYRKMLDNIESTPQLKDRILLVKYEDLCNDTDATLTKIVRHVGLSESRFASIKAQYVEKLTEPDYYTFSLEEKDIQAIKQTTAEVAQYFGYF